MVLIFPLWNLKVRTRLPSFASQIITELSVPAVANCWLPGAKRRSCTLWLPISKLCTFSFVFRSQIRTLLSEEELMRNLLFDEKSSDSTILSWPLNVFRCNETPFSHICTVPSPSAEIILLPFLSYPVMLIKGPDSVIWCSRVPFARLHVSSLPPAVPTTISASFGWMLIVETASSKFIVERCFLTF